MPNLNPEEEKITIKQSLMLIAGLVVILWWLRLPTALPSPGVLQKPAPLPYELVIPKLLIHAPIVYAASAQEHEIQNLLQSGVVHLSGTAEPGEVGNCYIVGHSSDYLNALGHYKTVFAGLPELKKGDRILIQTQDQTLEYFVQETRVVEPDDLSVLSQQTGGKKRITLQTSYPIGSARQRFIAVAEQKEK